MNGNPSATALLIAASTAYCGTDPDIGRFVPADAAAVCRRFVDGSSRQGRWLLGAMERQWFRWAVQTLERLMSPGIQLHYMLRKRYIEDVTRAALSDGCAQVVILGAGFDTLALRLHAQHPSARFIELDHPSTQQLKRQVAVRDDLARSNLTFCEVDFVQPDLSRHMLRCAGYRPDAPTLFIAEGLLMFLPPDAVSAILRLAGDHENLQSRLTFTFLETQVDGRVSFRQASRAVDLWLRLKGEPFRWSIRRHDLPTYLRSNGLTLRELATAPTLRRYLPADCRWRLPLAEGECICVAEKAGKAGLRTEVRGLRTEVRGETE